MRERNRHPFPDELLRLAIGDLQAEEHDRVQSHVDGCQECLAQVEEFRETEREFLSAYQSDYKPSVSPPPRDWQGFRGALMEQASGQVTWAARFKAFMSGLRRMPRSSYALPALCAIALAVLAVVRFNQAPVVSAGEILRRATTAERDCLKQVGHAAVYQKMRVRVGRATLTRVVFRDVERHRQVDRWSASDQVSPIAPSTFASNLGDEFRAARLDWDDPLSPTGMRGWLEAREQRNHHSQDVKEDAGAFTLTSRVPSEPVTEAQFVVRAADYHPISARYQFRDKAGDVELTELAYEVRGVETLDASVRSELSSRPDAPDSALASGRPALISAKLSPLHLDSLEIAALYALHLHRADLGGETEVARQGGEVKVAGVVVSLQRKAELRAALAHLPELHVDVQTAQEAAERQAHAIASATETPTIATARTAALKDALATRFPDPTSRDTFVMETLECSQQALARGFALRRLAVLYGVDNGASLPRASQLELQAMSLDHLQALRKDLDSLIERIGWLAGDTPKSRAFDENSAQPDPAALVADLQKLDRMVTRLVSGDEADSADSATLLRKYQTLAGRLRREVARVSVLSATR